MLLGEKLHREERSLVQLTGELLCLCPSHVSVSGGVIHHRHPLLNMSLLGERAADQAHVREEMGK